MTTQGTTVHEEHMGMKDLLSWDGAVVISLRPIPSNRCSKARQPHDAYRDSYRVDPYRDPYRDPYYSAGYDARSYPSVGGYAPKYVVISP